MVRRIEMKCPNCGQETKSYWGGGSLGMGKKYYKCSNCGEHWDSRTVKETAAETDGED